MTLISKVPSRSVSNTRTRKVSPTRHPRDPALPTTRRRRRVRKCSDSEGRERPRPAVQVMGSWVGVRGLRGQGTIREEASHGTAAVRSRGGPAALSPGLFYLLAVEMARNRLPPRTTNVWPRSASPAELAMGPPAASAHVRCTAPFRWRPPVTSVRAARSAYGQGACAQGGGVSSDLSTGGRCC